MPAHVCQLRRAMVSINVLEHRKSDFPAPDGMWMLDSGAFTRITSGKGHMPVNDYARLIERWSNVGRMVCAVSQDYMCEPFVLARTGMTIEEHQTLTTRRYIDLRHVVDGDIYVLPVLQGYSPDSYARHCWQMAPMLDDGMWVGVGSVCKRNVNPAAISAVLTAILDVRPDLKLHGFGLKTTSLTERDIAVRLHSSDSMAWSYAGRLNGRGANNPQWAREWADSIENLPIKDSQVAFAF